MIMKRDVDIRKDVHANVVLPRGTTIFERIGSSRQWILLHLMSFKVVASPEREDADFRCHFVLFVESISNVMT